MKCHYCEQQTEQEIVWLKNKFGEPARIVLPWCGCDLNTALKRFWKYPYPVREGIDYEIQRKQTMHHPKTITREEFDAACDALWSEIEYQNTLPIRTPDEAKDIPSFCTLGRAYLRKVEDAWATQPANEETGVVEDAAHGCRKLAAIFLRAMMYSGIRHREKK